MRSLYHYRASFRHCGGTLHTSGTVKAATFESAVTHVARDVHKDAKRGNPKTIRITIKPAPKS